MDRHGTFFWTELNTGDVEKAKAFFGETIGWTFATIPDGDPNYWIAYNNGIPQAGIVPLDMFAPPGAPPHWFSYLAVDDVDKRLEALLAAGGHNHSRALRCARCRPHRDHQRSDRRCDGVDDADRAHVRLMTAVTP